VKKCKTIGSSSYRLVAQITFRLAASAEGGTNSSELRLQDAGELRDDEYQGADDKSEQNDVFCHRSTDFIFAHVFEQSECLSHESPPYPGSPLTWLFDDRSCEHAKNGLAAGTITQTAKPFARNYLSVASASQYILR
jgi:hypothetical protein